MTIRNPPVLDSLSVNLQVVVVMREKHTAFNLSMCKLNWVKSTEQASFLRGRDIDTPSPETLCNDWVHILVEMKANRPWHPLP